MKKFIGMAALVVLAAGMAVPALADGAADYKAKCAMCHGADGSGKPAMKIVSFKDPSMVKLTDAQLTASTADGKGKMPAYKGKLTDAQIKDVVAFIRTLQK